MTVFLDGESLPEDAPDLWRPEEPFPPYRFVPGKNPHPFAQKGGYAFGERPLPPPFCSLESWREHPPYLRGVDFFNRGWWWEAHEIWEGAWHACEGRESVQREWLQGLIQLAACALNRERDHHDGADRLLQSSIDHLEAAREGSGGEERLGGLNVEDLVQKARDFLTPRTLPKEGFYLVLE